MPVTYTSDSDDTATYVQSAGSSVSYLSNSNMTSTYSVGRLDDILGNEFLIDIDSFYIVDSQSTRIIIGGGFEADNDTSVIYTVGL